DVACANRAGRVLLGGDAGAAGDPDRARRLGAAVRRLAPGGSGDDAGAVVTLASPPAVLRARLWQAAPGLVGVELQAVRLPESELRARLHEQLELAPERSDVAAQVIHGLTASEIAKALGLTVGRTRGVVAALGRQLGAPDATELVYTLRRMVGAPVARARPPGPRPAATGAPAGGPPPSAAPVRGVRAVALGQEVSNRVPLILLALCQRRGLAPAHLLAGLGLSEAGLGDPGGRHGWEQFAALLERISEALGGPPALAECVAGMILSHDLLYVLAGILVSPAQTYAYGVEHVLRSLFRHLGLRFEALDDGRLRLELGFPTGYRVSPTCWHAVAGALRVVPRLWRQADASVVVTAGAQRAVFVVTLPGPPIAPGPERSSVSPWLAGILGGAAPPPRPPAPGEPAFQVELALDGSGNVDTAQLLGKRLAGRADAADLVAELGTVLHEQFLIRRAALWGRTRAGDAPVAVWTTDDGEPAGASRTEPLLVDEVEVGRLEVEAPVTRSPLFRSLLPWIAVGYERVARGARVDDRDGSAQVAQAARAWGLTRRQREVLVRVVQGMANKEVAADLGCSVRAVEVHLTRLFGRAGVTSRTALLARVWAAT
ncbi:MAG TPA: LuxR C-terminal-related transcriptional regulator, partial [Polyangia bacterium]